ncbi:hypothetical protein Lalb_Chr03g0041631 [Lupinus albus]|uniref:Uncharacterized protein n=1 Tax=Lupinus albus TaxID=3870 RepID=A0A6A4QV77_LUPAL|nr:hypothetical protein Lalb_Chr03g0041631 [Lupinus albus]
MGFCIHLKKIAKCMSVVDCIFCFASVSVQSAVCIFGCYYRMHFCYYSAECRVSLCIFTLYLSMKVV